MLTETEKTDTRRFCFYPALAGQALLAAAPLEYRMNHLSSAEETVLRDYLATLRQLELAIPSAASNLDTAQVAVWTHNANELRERTALFDAWRRRLCVYLGVPSGAPAQAGVTLVV
jgi:hypothetical protein